MKILLLGAARHQVPAVEAALREGMEVFTADNVPSNPGHRLASRSFDVSAADPDAITRLAEELRVDGVLGFASEVCARTAARVAARLGLPGSPLEAVETLSFKDAFRRCTQSAGLQSLAWRCYRPEEVELAAAWAGGFPSGVVVKPVDSSGGRGVTVHPAHFRPAFERAAAASREGRVVVEERVVPAGGQFGGDGWMEQGRLKVLHCFDNDTLPAPDNGAAIQETFPCGRDGASLERMRHHLEALMQACGYTRGSFNFDGCFLEDGRPFVFEIGPRNGGNFIPHQIQQQTGVDLTMASVRAAVDPGFELPVPGRGEGGEPRFHATWVVHARQGGIMRGVKLAQDLDPYVQELIHYVSPGMPVRAFATSGDALGMLLLQFPTRESMLRLMAQMPALCQIELDPPP
jgi:biotin carboxylase